MTAEELTKAFLKTPAMVEHARSDRGREDKLDTDDTVTVGLKVPKPFITMLEFEARAEAAEQGRAPDTVGEMLGPDASKPASGRTPLAYRRPGPFRALPRPLEPLLR